MGEKVDFLNQIMDLPPFVVHHIMSYFSSKELAQSSLLSRRWNELRKSFPILQFDHIYFLGEDLTRSFFSYDKRDRKLFLKRIKRFIEFVNVTLDEFYKLEFRLHKFKLCISLLQFYRPYSIVHKWIELAVENGVKEIDLDVKTDQETTYTLPQTIYYAKLLTTLKLCGCKLEVPLHTIRLHSLRKLTIEYVDMDERVLQKLDSECRSLEDFSIKDCRGLKRFHVSKFPNLKVLMITGANFELESIGIFVPSLQKVNLMAQASCVVDMPCTTPHLKYLNLVGLSLTDQQFDNLMSKLPLLEDLYIACCPCLENIRISSKGIKQLNITGCVDLKVIDVDTPHLLSFFLAVHPLLSFKINASCKCKWEVHSIMRDNMGTGWHLHVKNILSAINQIPSLHIGWRLKEVRFDLDEFRSRSPSFPSNLGKLYLSIGSPSSTWQTLLDSIFGICYPQCVLLGTWDPPTTKFAEWLYEEMMNRKSMNCCSSRHFKCWRHYLKNFKVEFVPTDDKATTLTEIVKDNLLILPHGRIWFNLSWE